MKELNYKLIVSDFDGTLIDDKQQILAPVKKAIYGYIAAGGVFAVCTGRMLCSILPIVRGLGLKGLVIANQGTVIAEIESGKVIKNGGMKAAGVYEICRFIESLNQNVNVYCDDKIYTNIPKGNPHLQEYERIIGVDATFVEGKISDFVLKNGFFCQKVAVLVASNERNELYAKIKRKFGEKYDVTCSAKVLVEVSPFGENKGEGIKFLAKYFSIPIEKSVAAGDSLNDLPMIEAAGVGVCVANGEESLKAAADFVSVTNNEGAIAQIIDKFGYKND